MSVLEAERRQTTLADERAFLRNGATVQFPIALPANLARRIEKEATTEGKSISNFLEDLTLNHFVEMPLAEFMADMLQRRASRNSKA